MEGADGRQAAGTDAVLSRRKAKCTFSKSTLLDKGAVGPQLENRTRAAAKRRLAPRNCKLPGRMRARIERWLRHVAGKQKRRVSR